MSVFLRLLLAYLLAEFVFPQQQLIKLKTKNGFWGYVIHALVFFALCAVLCLGSLGEIWLQPGPVPLNGWACLALLGFAHALIDFINKADLAVAGRFNTLLFLLWQSVSVLLLFLIFPPSSAQTPRFDNFLIVLAGAVFVTYVLMAFLHFVRKDIWAEEYPTADERYTNIFMRLVLYLLLLAQGFWGYALGAAWVVALLYFRRARVVDVCPVRFYGGLPLAFIAAVIVRTLIY
ncbi:MAG: DUF3307 domain-containing protein [Elusimicrobiota bacterium]|jgi:hypothetical protein|nr:DUF3307 domain-containing protein [Elusimicrobiota bacterium]